MDYNLYQSMFSNYPLQTSTETVCDVQAHRLNTLGCVQIQFTLGGRVLTEPFLVIKGIALGNKIFLGHPACRRHKISIHAGANGITVGKMGYFIPYEDVNRMEDMEVIERGEVLGGINGGDTSVMEKGNVKTHVGDMGDDYGGSIRVHSGNNDNNGGDDTNMDVISDTNNAGDDTEGDNLYGAVARGDTNHKYRGVLFEDIMLLPGSKIMVKVKLKEMRKPIDVCVIENSEKLRVVVSTASVNSVSKDGVTWVALLNCNDTARRYQKNTYILDFQNWNCDSGSVAIVEGKPEFSEAEIKSRKRTFREHLANADYSEHVEAISGLLAEFGDMVALQGDKLGLTNVLRVTQNLFIFLHIAYLSKSENR
ncbi:uncharacterized protein LOC135220267 [Macrobrachium nipponense]|uniref:uncharacterized protein LOC135220267 n=1 Tax=Macrobrachium nipponense TaxID=159736 RepID=UPI0030C84B5A